VTGVCSTAKVEFVRSLGADEVIDYTRDGIGSGYDVIVDTGGDRPLGLLRRALRPRGTLVLVGGSYHKGGLMGGWLRQMLRAPLMGLFVRERMRNLTGREKAAHLDSLRELIEAGSVTPAIGRTYSLCEAADAIRDLRAGKVPGKLVVTV
jgi:NADPH:quinone reductase-like Zn-dependent oxidoreductase